MTTVARRRSNPVAEVLSWFDSETPFAFRTEATPFVRLEDYVEDGTYVLRAEVPGVDPEKDLEVTITSDTVTIRGERREEERDRRHREIHYGEFIRSVRLPRGSRTADVSATCVDGVLEVRVPLEGGTDAATHSVPIARKAG